MIPKIIWQTYETEYDLLPDNIKEYSESWRKNYQDFKYIYMDSKQREDFVLKEFGREWFNIFISLPHNIMKANLWRYMVVYIHGGIYFDLDTSPILNIDDIIKKYKMVLFADESEDLLFFIQVIAATPKHPVLKSVLDYIFDLIKITNFKQEKINKYFVFKYSGEVAFFNGVQKILNPDKAIVLDTADSYNLLNTTQKYEVFVYGKEYDIFNGKAFKNLDGANNWKTGYTNWWEETK